MKVTKDTIFCLFYAIVSLIKYEVFYGNRQHLTKKKKSNLKNSERNIHLPTIAEDAGAASGTPVPARM